MDNEHFSPNEQLKVIQMMIEKTKKETAENGWSLIMWGWLLLASCLSAYVIFWMKKYEWSFLPWALLMPLGGIIQMIVELKEKDRKKIKTYAERAISWVWIVCGGAMFFIGFVAVPTHILSGWESITAMECLIAGIGSVVTAKIIDWDFMFYSALLWFVAVILMIFIHPYYHILIMGITIIPAYLVPGYILRSKYKQA
ncbi:MAG: hypothetical protein JXQ65_07200 [Candidatus Marinimicrobia bacterium]|nr:hypothetical protein [Candidatus Neomarinimicrobiota bacterium]